MKHGQPAWRVCGLVVLFALAPTGVLAGQAAGSTGTDGVLLTLDARRTIERGLAALAARQLPSGAFARDARNRNAHPGVTALAGMAFLASGSTAVRGPYRDVVNRITDYLVDRLEPKTGLIRDTLSQAEPMYSHTFATLYLAEVSGEDRRPVVHNAIRKATNLIVAAQRENGGWRYRVGGRDADVSVTACAVVALKGARVAGVRVPPTAIRRAIEYVLRCAKGDGSFQYQAQGGHATFQLTAAAVTALFAAGAYDGPEIRRALAYLKRFRTDQGQPILGHFFYGHYYAIQAAHHARGAYFREWYVPLRDKLVRDQSKDGRWRRSTVGDVYATAMAVLILAIPKHHLPIFVR